MNDLCLLAHCPHLLLHTPWVGDVSPVVFLDRDGVLNVDHGYVGSVERWEWQLGAIDALHRLQTEGFKLVVVTNQSGVARGLYDAQAVEQLMDWVARELRAREVFLTATAYCPHLECPYRKPSPGMLLEVMNRWPVDKKQSFLIGDSPRDVQAAEEAGVPGYLYRDGSVDEFVKTLLKRRAE